jgi:hypothetical protein
MLHYPLVDIFRARKGDYIVGGYFNFYIFEVTKKTGIDKVNLKVLHILLQSPFAGFYSYILFGERLYDLSVFEFQRYAE